MWHLWTCHFWQCDRERGLGKGIHFYAKMETHVPLTPSVQVFYFRRKAIVGFFTFRPRLNEEFSFWQNTACSQIIHGHFYERKRYLAVFHKAVALVYLSVQIWKWFNICCLFPIGSYCLLLLSIAISLIFCSHLACFLVLNLKILCDFRFWTLLRIEIKNKSYKMFTKEKQNKPME